MVEKFIFSIDQCELAMLLIRELVHISPPPGTSAHDAIDQMPADIRHDFLRAARAVAEFVAAQITAAGKQTQIVELPAVANG